MRTLQTRDGTTLAYSDSGTGRPIVFVHGWTLNQEMWDFHGRRLSKEFRCVTYDRRGHGRSSIPDAGYDADTMADDLAELLDHLDLAEVTLVSHSTGSGEIARYLSRHGSERIAGTVMIAAGSPMASWAEDNPRGVKPDLVKAALEGFADDRAHWFDSRRNAYFALPAQAGRISPAMVDLTLRMCLQTPMDVQLATMEAMLTTDYRKDYGSIDVPSTIVHGALDQSTPLETCGVPTSALIPQCDLRVYAEAAHGIYITHRTEMEAEIRLAVDALAVAS